jgi:hypothetical protein
MTSQKFAVTFVLNAAISVLLAGAVAAQEPSRDPAGAAELFCDYCGDYTDGVATNLPSAYRPGEGYPAELAKKPDAQGSQAQEEARVRPLGDTPPTQIK